MTSHEDISAVLATIQDPEMPISIVDLGLIEDVVIHDGNEGQRVDIVVLPTIVGCPALEKIREQIHDAVSALDGVDDVNVEFVYEPAWTIDRISDAGRASLAEHGVTVPERGSGLSFHQHLGSTVTVRTSAVPCPFCGSTSTELDSPFGPTRCRSIFYCRSCRNSFEHMKRI
ncbi:MAG: phenylacetate-CoA oxygenase subunit PaaJ [Phycisphaerales bacterium]|nr:phenylacetate-CoA oxygenase subunit PaaJ [Phycisphaerales bacterium]